MVSSFNEDLMTNNVTNIAIKLEEEKNLQFSLCTCMDQCAAYKLTIVDEMSSFR